MNTLRPLFVATAVALLAACTPHDATPAATGTTAPSDAMAAAPAESQARTIAVGENLDIELPGNPGTGYTWELVQDGAPVLTQQSPPAAAAVAPASQPAMVGAPEPTRFRFVGAQAGKTTLHFVYHRPWEKDVPPAQEKRYEVEVH